MRLLQLVSVVFALAVVGCGQPDAATPPVEVQPTSLVDPCELDKSRCEVDFFTGSQYIEVCSVVDGRVSWHAEGRACHSVCFESRNPLGVQTAQCGDCHPNDTMCNSNHVLLRCDDAGHWQEDDYC